MLKFFYHMGNVSHIDPRIYELEKDLDFYQFIFWGSIVVIILLGIIIYLQRISITGYRKGKESKILPRLLRKNYESDDKKEPPKPELKTESAVPKNLLDPGLVFKYSLSREGAMDRLITIGQTEGNIKTNSTEVLNNHLSIQLRIIDSPSHKDMNTVMGKIIEEYQIDLRRDGNVLILIPGHEGFRVMNSRERIFIRPDGGDTAEPVLQGIDAKSPIRFRIGERLNQDGRFANGYFEFHLYTQDYGITTHENIPKIERNFLVRLYKIYPGYDTASPTSDGLFPMVVPYVPGS